MFRNMNFLEFHKKNQSCSTFVIAEAGVHHGCNLDIAKRLIDTATQAGADAIKFQTYKADTLVTHWAPKYWYQNNDKDRETQFRYFKKRDKLEFEHYRLLFDYTKKKGIHFCSTPFDQQSVKWLNDLNIPFWKVASGDIDNYPLLEEIAKTKKPMILSTGASYFREIRETIDFLKSKDVRELVLLHCNLAYPTPNNEANLLRIVELKKLFPEIMIGYSDHTVPDDNMTIPAIAVALGARIIEKHFTLDRMLLEDDHYHSADPALLRRMIDNIKLAEDLTTPVAEITDSEIPARRNARRSLVANEFIPKGTVLSREMVIPKRPGGSIPPAFISDVVGRRTKMTLERDQQLHWNILE